MFPDLLKLILFACNKCHFWAKLKRSNAKNRPAMPLSFDSLIKKILTKLMLARKPMILLLENTQEKDNLVYLKFCNISIAAGIYLHKVSNRNTRTWCLFCELWTYFTPYSSVSIVNFEHIIAGWYWYWAW